MRVQHSESTWAARRCAGKTTWGECSPVTVVPKGLGQDVEVQRMLSPGGMAVGSRRSSVRQARGWRGRGAGEAGEDEDASLASVFDIFCCHFVISIYNGVYPHMNTF